jgi:carbonic anhydrase/acetyltransferase-like protein (isoleucine patch superfamily)
MIYSLGERKPVFVGDYFVANSAVIVGSVRLEQNVSVWFNAVLRGDNEWITVGENSNIQDGSVLHADPGIPLTVGRNVTIGHMVVLHGCRIGDNSLIGIKSVVLNGAQIGRNCLIGANTLITERKQIPDNSLVVGSPGRILRTLTMEEVERFANSSLHYVENLQRYCSLLNSIDDATEIESQGLE